MAAFAQCLIWPNQPGKTRAAWCHCICSMVALQTS